MFVWSNVIAVPLLVGASFIGVAIAAMRMKPDRTGQKSSTNANSTARRTARNAAIALALGIGIYFVSVGVIVLMVFHGMTGGSLAIFELLHWVQSQYWFPVYSEESAANACAVAVALAAGVITYAVLHLVSKPPILDDPSTE